MASSAKTGSGAMRAFAIVAGIVVLLAAGLVAAWFYLAGELDRRAEAALQAAAGRGVTVGCANRSVFGFPFRLGLSCDAVTLHAPESAVNASGGAVRTAAQIYDPSRIVLEFDGPASVEAPDLPPFDVLWRLGRASAVFDGLTLDRLSIAVDAPLVALRQPASDRLEVARSERFEIHARRNAGDLDLAIRDEGLVVTPPGLASLPPFDLYAEMAVAGAQDWLSQGLPGGRLDAALRGRDGHLRMLRLDLQGGGAAEISGPYAISQGGEISGDFALAVENPQAIAGLVETLLPGSAGVASALAGGLAFAGRQENGRTVVDIQVREGRAQLGFIPLGRIPPI
ncbi:DUF2125 domain-containing protein [Aureimonas populi]|uniref:DUF2125 domain-containing protein n=1 Tax=Aureimonas populi TaxID=1701758 RepID=A0ABW5CL34_9HYPH|nr:DUF2125 domain-containing protein [Aureimonas populi]